MEESIAGRFVDELVRRAQDIRLGGPFDDAAETGPLISAAHRDKVHAYVQHGIQEGARLRCGGAAPQGGALLYRLKIRHPRGALAEHAAAVAAHPSSGSGLQAEPAETHGAGVKVPN